MSRGSVDTDLDQDEVEDLKADLDIDSMPTTSRKKSTPPKKATPKKATGTVNDLSPKMSSMKVSKVEYVALDWRFPMAMYSVHEGSMKKVFIELLKGVQLSPEYIVHAKVLPGGMQFSLLCGMPHWMYEETYMKARMGKHHNTGSALYQAFDRFCIQSILKLFPGSSAYLEGSPQIVQLEEECAEGPVPYIFGNTKTKGTNKVNNARQYQSTMTFELTAVQKKAVKVAKPKTVFWGSMLGSSDSDSDSKDSEMGEEKRTRTTKLLFVLC